MASILADVSSIVSTTVSGVTSFAGAITANPIIEVFVITGLVFLGLNAMRKLMNV